MLSKILRFFAQDQEAEVKEDAQHTTSSLQETPQLLDKANIGLIILDSNDCILYINSVSSLDLNIPKDYLGTKFVEVFNNSEIINLIKNVKVNSSAEEEIFGVEPGNKSFLVNATYDNESFETTLVFIDITRIKKLENIRKDFIANLSHELRTPVAVIRANSESLVDGALDDKEIAQKFSKAILKNSEKLSYLLADILNLSTIESGEYNLELAENGVSDIFETSINSVLSNNPDVKIINNISLDTEVICDIKALSQVIDNLIENAIKYGITVDSNQIFINMKDQGSKVRFEIEDHGQGIPADQRERVFERFLRIQNNNSSLKEGTGLGLSIVKNLVNLMGGSVGNEKAYPEGTIFWFTLNKKKLIFFPNLFLLRNTNVTFAI
jgi:two-component system phosphate regulon sensor histidine kinase PhoR